VAIKSSKHEAEVLEVRGRSPRITRQKTSTSSTSSLNEHDIQNTTTAEIVLERATHSHSHDYSVASDKFISQGVAHEYTTNFKHNAKNINRYQNIHIQSESVPSTTAGMPLSLSEIDADHETN